jgi:anti-repressor protein
MRTKMERKRGLLSHIFAREPTLPLAMPAPTAPQEAGVLPALIESEIGGESVQTTNARDLYQFLGVRDTFATWLWTRLNEYSFMEGKDYCLDEIGNYHLSIDMAKELSMVEKTPKGTEARHYFIECEKKLRRGDSAADLNNPRFLRGLLSNWVEKYEQVEHKLAQAAPAVEFHKAFVACEKLYGLQEASRAFGMKPNALPSLLRKRRKIFVQNGKNFPFAQFGESGAGFFVVKLADPENPRSSNTYITSKGMAWIGKNLLKMPPESYGKL